MTVGGDPVYVPRAALAGTAGGEQEMRPAPIMPLSRPPAIHPGRVAQQGGRPP
jgi:hypothetical protein